MMFTKTETLRRLRLAANLVRENDGLAGRTDIVEVGIRNETKYVDSIVDGEDGWLGDDAKDDLYDFDRLFNARSREVLRTPGAMAHFYFTGSGWNGELNTIRIVWLGTEDHEPVYIG